MKQAYATPEDYIRGMILTEHSVQKQELVKMVALATGRKEADLAQQTKTQLIDTLIEVCGPECLRQFPVGVPSIDWQRKFDITNQDVKRMAEKGFLTVTGSEEFAMYGKTRRADTYSPYQFYTLTRKEIHQWLKADRRGWADRYMAMVQQDGMNLAKVPREKWTKQLLMAAVHQNGMALRFIPLNRLSPRKMQVEIATAAVQSDERAMRYVPEDLRPIVESAVQQVTPRKTPERDDRGI